MATGSIIQDQFLQDQLLDRTAEPTVGPARCVARGRGRDFRPAFGLILVALGAPVASAQTIKLSWTLYDAAFDAVANFSEVDAGTVYAVLTARITDTDRLAVLAEQRYATSTEWAGGARVTPEDPGMSFSTFLPATAAFFPSTSRWILGGPRAVRWQSDMTRVADLGFFELHHDGGLTLLTATLDTLKLTLSDCPFDTGCDLIGGPTVTSFDESAFTIINPGLAGFGVPTPAAAGIAAIAGVHASRRRR